MYGINGHFSNVCEDVFLLSLTDWFKAVRATSIMGFISLLVALVMTILKMFFMKDKKPIVLAAIGTAFIGGKSYIDKRSFRSFIFYYCF